MSGSNKCAECGKPTNGEFVCNDECQKLYDETMAKFGIKRAYQPKKLFPQSKKLERVK